MREDAYATSAGQALPLVCHIVISDRVGVTGGDNDLPALLINLKNSKKDSADALLVSLGLLSSCYLS